MRELELRGVVRGKPKFTTIRPTVAAPPPDRSLFLPLKLLDPEPSYLRVRVGSRLDYVPGGLRAGRTASTMRVARRLSSGEPLSRSR